jgi:hypothetical protein
MANARSIFINRLELKNVISRCSKNSHHAGTLFAIIRVAHDADLSAAASSSAQ